MEGFNVSDRFWIEIIVIIGSSLFNLGLLWNRVSALNGRVDRIERILDSEISRNRKREENNEP